MKISSFFKHRKLVTLDKKSTNAVVLAIKKADDQGDYKTFKRYIENAPLDIIVEFAHKYPDSPIIQKYTKQATKTADAHFLYGNYLMNKAWQSKSESTQKTQSVHKSTTFSRFLNAAQLELCQVLRLNPNYLPAFALLLKVQRGKNNKKLAQTIYQQAKKIAPDLMDYHIELMSILGPKHGGSYKAMFNFAYECAQKDPTGILHGLIPIVHFEYWYSLSEEGAKYYLNNKKIKQEIKQAYLEVKNAEFEQTYYHQHQYYVALNYFSLLFLLMGDKEQAKNIFNHIEGKYSYKPWAYMGENPGLTYLDYKNSI